jgi:addiction module RelB/DinJ family antitoxin
MAANTTLFRARVPAQRLKNAEKILAQLGMKPSDAFNMLLAQIELRKGVPFEITTEARPMLSSSDEQGAAWTEAFGAY